MKNKTEIRLCKKCKKSLPEGYKHKYCEACHNRQAQIIRNGLKGAAGIAGTAACVVLAVATKGKIDLKPKN